MIFAHTIDYLAHIGARLKRFFIAIEIRPMSNNKLLHAIGLCFLSILAMS